MAKNNNNLKVKYLLVLLISIATVFLSFYFQGELLKLGSWGLLGIFLINIIGSATLFIPAPAIATVFAGGIVYNPFLVAVLAALGSVIGDMVGYFLGRSGKEVLIRKESFKYEVIRDVFHKFAPIFIILISFIPNPFFDAIGIFAGLFKYPPLKFFIYTLIGRFLRNLLLAYIGSTI